MAKKRIPLKKRILPDYTKGEEIFNMVTHIVGGGLGVVYLVACVIISAIHRDPWAVVSSAIYGASVILLFTMSSVYHGLIPSTGKKVLQIIDHCTIYVMIAGTYTPYTLVAMRENYPVTAWVVFGIVWGTAALAITLNAIDLEKYKVFAMICYIAMGWCIVFTGPQIFASLPGPGFWWLLFGGILYTVGVIFYGFGKKARYIHSVFHIFVVLGSAAHFVSLFFYVL